MFIDESRCLDLRDILGFSVMSDAQPATPSAESKDIVTTITTTTMPEVEETSSSENTSKKFQAEMLEVAFTEEEIEEMKKQIAHQDEKKMGQYWYVSISLPPDVL